MRKYFTRYIGVSILPTLVALAFMAGIGSAHATEITGTLGTSGSGSGGSSSGSPMAGTVVGGTPDSSSSSGSTGGTSGTSGGSTSQTSSASSGGSSGGSGGAVAENSGSSAPRSGQHRSSTYAAPSSGIESDGSLAQSGDYTGTGGGYDSALDARLASLQSGDSNVSPSDAVAFNRTGAPNPLAASANVAAAGAGTPGQKALALILIGLAVSGLLGYAVNAYLSYRKEKGF